MSVAGATLTIAPFDEEKVTLVTAAVQLTVAVIVPVVVPPIVKFVVDGDNDMVQVGAGGDVGLGGV